MNPVPRTTGTRRIAGLATIATAVAAGLVTLVRAVPSEGAPPALAAPSAPEPGSLALDARPAGSHPAPAWSGPARTRPPARAAAEVPLFDDAAPRPARGARPAGGEAAYYERFVATWRVGGDARRRLESRAPELLRAAETNAERVALLRALRDVGSSATPALLALALRELPDVSGPRGVSVPEFVVSLLGRAERLSPEERAVLEREVHNSSGGLGPNTRGRALRVLIASADESRALALTRVVEGEPDPLVREMGEQALRSWRKREDSKDE